MYIIPRSRKKCVGDGVNTSVNCQMAKIVMTIRGVIVEHIGAFCLLLFLVVLDSTIVIMSD